MNMNGLEKAGAAENTVSDAALPPGASEQSTFSIFISKIWALMPRLAFYCPSLMVSQMVVVNITVQLSGLPNQ